MWEVLQVVVLFAGIVCGLFFVFGKSYTSSSKKTHTTINNEASMKAKSSPREPDVGDDEHDDQDVNDYDNNNNNHHRPILEQDSPTMTCDTIAEEALSETSTNTNTTNTNEEENDKQDAQSTGTSTVTRRKVIDRATLLRARSTTTIVDSQGPKLLDKIKTVTTTTKAPKRDSFSQNDMSKFARLRAQSCPDSTPLETSTNRWVPTRSGLQPLEQAMKQAKGVLNKLTPENFDSLSAKVCALDLADGLLPAEFAQLLLETAIIYPLHGTTYAQLAVVLSKEWSNDQAPQSDFRTQLLSKCQAFFVERGVVNEEDDAQHRKRVVNAVRFIGALFCNRAIPASIVLICIQELLEGSCQTKEEQEIEALCTLVTSVGQKLDCEGQQAVVDKFFAQMQDLSNKDLPSRLRFLLLDTLDLRTNSWRPRRKQDVPQKLDNLRKEMERSVVYQPSLRTAQRQSSDGFQSRSARSRTSSGADDFLSPAATFRRDKSDLGKPKPRSPNTPDASPLSSPVFTSMPRSAPTHPLPSPLSPLPALQLPAQSAAAPRPVELPPSMASSLDLHPATAKPRMSLEDDSPTLIPITSPCITPPSSPTRQTPKERIQNLLRMFFLTQSHQHVISEMTADMALRNSIENFIAKGVSMSFDLGQSDRVRFVELMQNLVSSGFATSTTVTHALQAATTDLEDLVLDVPHSPKLAAFFLSQCFVNDLISAQDLVGIFQTIQKHSGGIADQVGAQVIGSIKEHKGLVGVQELLQQLEQPSES